MRDGKATIVASAALILMSCGSPADDTPLRGTQGGLAALRWGDGPEEVRRRMLEMPNVRLVKDTVEIYAFAAWMSPDTVEVPANIERHRRMEFRGGSFLGHPVEWWNLTLDEATSLCRLQVILISSEDAGTVRWKIRRQLHRLYGGSNEPDLDRFFADGWSTPATSASSARTVVGMGRYGSQIVVGFVDRAWEDSLRSVSSWESRRRMHVDEWRRSLAELAKQRGWRIEDLPPQ